MSRAYFQTVEGQPEPLRTTVTRRVRFEEVDSVGIVWHGRYPSYLEDARIALGDAYGVGYMDFLAHGILVPIKKIHVDFYLPLVFKEEISVEGILHWSEAARLNYEYTIRNGEGITVTRGYTVQMMLNMNREICMVPPDFYKAFLVRWKSGELSREGLVP